MAYCVNNLKLGNYDDLSANYKNAALLHQSSFASLVEWCHFGWLMLPRTIGGTVLACSFGRLILSCTNRGIMLSWG